jgi:hypothetical protein
MTGFDFLKAAGVALLLMVLNVVVAFGVVWAYSVFIEPGHDEAFYQAAAQRIAPWSSVVAGAFLFFGAGWLFAKRKPARNGLLFAAVVVGIYAAIDVSIIAASGALASLGLIVALSMATKLGAALFGAQLARGRAA